MATTDVISLSNWLSLLSESGALSVMGQDLTLWQNKPLFTNPRIQVMRFRSASEFINEVMKTQRISWGQLIAEMEKANWRVAEELKHRLCGGSSPLFAATGAPAAPQPGYVKTERMMLTPMAEFMDFFRNSPCVVDVNVADRTVELELEKALEHQLLKALRVETYPHAPGTPVVAALLKDYPELSWLVGLALIQLGHCTPYSKVQSRTSTLIQTTRAEDKFLSNAIHPVVDAYPLPRLANFMCDAKQDDAVWRGLFSGCDITTLENLLLEFGKTPQEIRAWSGYAPADRNATLVKAAADLGRTSRRSSEYKVRMLRFLRENRNAPHMLPWLTTEELTTWLNPKTTVEDRMVLEEPTPAPVSSERALVEALFAKAKVNKPAFIDLFISEGYRCEHLEAVLTHFDNPDTQPLRALLTGPNKLDVLTAVRASQ